MLFYLLILIAVVAAAFLILKAVDYLSDQQIAKKRPRNENLPLPEGAHRCPKCASPHTYELTNKRIFTNEILSTETGRFRCFDCNYYWEDKTRGQK